jgi:hypothetical protein
LYYLTAFDGLTLPSNLGSSGAHDITLAERPSPLVTLPGGVYDPRGADWAPRRQSRLQASVLIVQATSAAVRTVLDAWQAKVGKRGTLTRADDAGNQQTITARLVSAQASRRAENLRFLPLALTFETCCPVWSGAVKGPTVVLATTGATVLSSPNDGNARVTNPVLSIHAVTSAITVVEVAQAVTGGQISWYWTGTLAAGNTLAIDCGAMSVNNSGVNGYSGFGLYPTHTVDEWLRLEPGANTPTVKRTGGGATSWAGLVYNDGWA